jgi:hypothetical protein
MPHPDNGKHRHNNRINLTRDKRLAILAKLVGHAGYANR